jgi:hypothetical protein
MSRPARLRPLRAWGATGQMVRGSRRIPLGYLLVNTNKGFDELLGLSSFTAAMAPAR